jgi:hypothetical protein
VILLAVDPGKATGLAAWWDPLVYDSTKKGSPIDRVEVEDSTKVVSIIRRILDGERPSRVALERFQQDPRKTRQPAANHVIGAVCTWATENGVPYTFQSPGAAKKIAPTAILKKIGWWYPTPDGHQNSAIQHILLMMATYHPERFAQLVGI